jgi:hypothetical protein
MNIRHPVRSVSHALQCAIEEDLDDVVVHDGALRRPRQDECSVVLFSQSWSARTLGRDGGAVDADTVVITGPGGDACVYASTRLLYRVAHPNRRFFLDVAAQQMASTPSAYDGRDTADLEAIDYEVTGALSRLIGAQRALEAHAAAGVSRVLRDFARRFDAIAAM